MLEAYIIKTKRIGFSSEECYINGGGCLNAPPIWFSSNPVNARMYKTARGARQQLTSLEKLGHFKDRIAWVEEYRRDGIEPLRWVRVGHRGRWELMPFDMRQKAGTGSITAADAFNDGYNAELGRKPACPECLGTLNGAIQQDGRCNGCGYDIGGEL